MTTPIDKKALRELAGNSEPRSAIRRFVAKVAFEDNGCWLWIGSSSGRPGMTYPCFFDRKIIKGHRWSYQFFKGEIADGLFVLHKCDNPMCVNPDHLFLGTNQDNVKDAVSKGRHKNGEMAKTHCPKGHPYEGKNLYVYRNQRQCRTCRDAHRGRTPKDYCGGDSQPPNRARVAG